MLPQNGTREISRVRTFLADRAALEETAPLTGPRTAYATAKPQRASQAYEPEKLPPTKPDLPLPPDTLLPVKEKVQSPEPVPLHAEVQSKKPVPAAFVGLDSEFNAIARAKQQSVFADEGEYEGDALATGTIIRETKRKRFRLVPAMGMAFLGWARDIRDLYESSRPQTHTIASADTRAEVIIKAAEKSEIAPRNDLEAVTEHLKKVERKPISPTLTFKEKSEVPAPSWTYVEENAGIQRTRESQGSLKEPVAVDLQNPSDEEVGFAKEPEDAAMAAVVPEDIPTEETAAEILPHTDMQAQEDMHAEAYEAHEVELPSQPSHVPEAPALPEVQREPISSSSGQESERFPFTLLIGVIAVAVMSGMGISLFFFNHHKSPAGGNDHPATTRTATPLLLAVQSTTLIEPGSDRISFLKNVEETIAKTKDIAEIYPAAQEVPLETSDVLHILNFAMPDSFTRSIKQIDFGGIDGIDPYIVIKSTTFDIAFAGMLGWERYMSADLDPLFGNAFLRSYDPNSSEGPGPLRFKDIIASNKNARILYDENGRERIIYTFLDSNTILITDTKAALDRLIQRTQ